MNVGDALHTEANFNRNVEAAHSFFYYLDPEVVKDIFPHHRQ
jgi:hypothetical protein